jgi:hypothetical protein
MADTLSHCISNEIHVWSASRRGCEIIMPIAKEIEERYDIEFKRISCDKDHVHIYFVWTILKLYRVRLLGYSRV